MLRFDTGHFGGRQIKRCRVAERYDRLDQHRDGRHCGSGGLERASRRGNFRNDERRSERREHGDCGVQRGYEQRRRRDDGNDHELRRFRG
jgi:hypothetical protein